MDTGIRFIVMFVIALMVWSAPAAVLASWLGVADSASGGLIILFTAIALATVSATFLTKLENARQRRRPPFLDPDRCFNCGYDQRGIDGEICPECGAKRAWTR